MEDGHSHDPPVAAESQPGPESTQFNAQVPPAEDGGEPGNEETDKVEDAGKVEEAGKATKATCEFRKTWGFRRTTIAKRELPGDGGGDVADGRSAPVRRSGRQAKRTDKLEEFLSTAKRGRGGGRRSAPGHLESSDPPSQTPTDAETASEASFDGNADARTGDQATAKGGSVSDDGSSENDDNADAPPQKEDGGEAEAPAGPELRHEEDSAKKEEGVGEEEEEQEVKPDTEKGTSEPAGRRTAGSPARAACKDAALPRKDARPKSRGKASKDNKGEEEEDDDDEEEEDESSGKSDNEGYDPNALYCICRQKHNKSVTPSPRCIWHRFMICCDRCEEWFHGDCVGITEARGRLLERNGEDYICPNCTVRKGQPGKRLARRTQQSSPTDLTGPSAGSEDKPNEDLGIKGRIEKATNPSGKKKIKIFQPAVEAASLPKCIGPGCERNALPDSVYCGNDCILRHAAATMKSITDVKEPKAREKAKPRVQKRPATRSTPKKRPGPGRRLTDDEETDSEEEGEEVEQEAPVSSWSSDHNYNAVTPEKTAHTESALFNKPCMYLVEL